MPNYVRRHFKLGVVVTFSIATPWISNDEFVGSAVVAQQHIGMTTTRSGDKIQFTVDRVGILLVRDSQPTNGTGTECLNHCLFEIGGGFYVHHTSRKTIDSGIVKFGVILVVQTRNFPNRVGKACLHALVTALPVPGRLPLNVYLSIQLCISLFHQGHPQLTAWGVG